MNRIGLVLAGGGAKGAFQWGVIRALRDRDINFAAVAGTSVGALNAALFATRSFELGDALWGDLSIGTLSTQNKRHALLNPLILVKVFFGVLAGVYLSIPAPAGLRSVSTRLSLLLFLHSIAVWFAFCLCLGPWGLFVGFPLYFLASLPSPSNAEEHARKGGKQTTHYCLTALISVPAAILGYCLGVPPITWLAISFIGLIVLTFAILKTPALQNGGLRNVLSELASQKMGVPCYATTASVKPLYDPTNPLYMTYMSGMDYHHIQRIGLYPEHLYVANYTLLTDLGSKAASILVQSANLPLGIFTTQLEDEDIVDGGLADNVPLLPLVEMEQCDALLVITLDGLNNTLADLFKSYRMAHRNQQLKTHTISWWGKPQPTVLDESERFLEQLGSRIVSVTLPRKASPFDTLRFTRKAASKWFREGYDIGKTLDISTLL